MKKVFLLVVCIVLCFWFLAQLAHFAVQVPWMIETTNRLINEKDIYLFEVYQELFLKNSISAFFLAVSLIFLSYIAVGLFKDVKKSEVPYAIRYTYEEFKEKMQAKKASREAEQKSKRMASLKKELAALQAEQEESTE